MSDDIKELTKEELGFLIILTRQEFLDSAEAFKQIAEETSQDPESVAGFSFTRKDNTTVSFILLEPNHEPNTRPVL